MISAFIADVLIAVANISGTGYDGLATALYSVAANDFEPCSPHMRGCVGGVSGRQ